MLMNVVAELLPRGQFLAAASGLSLSLGKTWSQKPGLPSIIGMKVGRTPKCLDKDSMTGSVMHGFWLVRLRRRTYSVPIAGCLPGPFPFPSCVRQSNGSIWKTFLASNLGVLKLRNLLGYGLH